MSTKTKKKAEPIREHIQAEYRFTDQEKQELGKHLAQLLNRREEIDAEKKQSASQYSARLQEVSAQISLASNKLCSGFETRAVLAVVEYDTERGVKQFWTDDEPRRRKLVKEDPMTPSDWQLPMFREEEMGTGAAPQPEAPAPSPQRAAPVDDTSENPSNANDGAKHGSKAGRGKGAGSPDPVNPGQNNLGDALVQAFAGADVPKIPFILNDMTRSDSSRFMKEFRRAATKAEWPEAAINLMRDVLRGCDDIAAMKETLRPHIAPSEEKTPTLEENPLG